MTPENPRDRVVLQNQREHQLNGTLSATWVKNPSLLKELVNDFVMYQVRIQDLVKGGAPASEAESCRCSGAESRERSELSAAGVQGPLKGPGSFWVLSAQICILPHSRAPFSLISDIYIKTKNLQLLLNKKWYAERSEAGKFLNSNCKK